MGNHHIYSGAHTTYNRGRHVLSTVLRCETDAEIPILSIMEAIWPLKQVESIIHSSKTLMALLSPLIATWHDTHPGKIIEAAAKKDHFVSYCVETLDYYLSFSRECQNNRLLPPRLLPFFLRIHTNSQGFHLSSLFKKTSMKNFTEYIASFW